MFQRKRLTSKVLDLRQGRNLQTNNLPYHVSYNIPYSRRLRLLYYALFFICTASIILVFGTVYSNLTARDPCKVYSSWIRSTSSAIPKLLHYQSKYDILTAETKTWFSILNISDKIIYPNIEASDSWRGAYWSDESCSRLVHDRFPEFIRTYDGFAHTIQRVDACRYLILKEYGGIYADTDISLHIDIINLIPNGIGLVESPYRYNENVQNSLMSATSPNHEFWNVVIELMKERGNSHAILSTTGPSMLDHAIARYKNNVHVLPCELFQRLPVGQWDTTFMNILGRDVLARAIPMKGCGRFGDGKCEVTRHSGKASWTVESGKII